MKKVKSKWSKQPSSKTVEGSLKGGIARRLPKSKWQNQMTQKLLYHQEALQPRIIQSLNSSNDQINIQAIVTINRLNQSIHESSYHLRPSIIEIKPHNVRKVRAIIICACLKTSINSKIQKFGRRPIRIFPLDGQIKGEVVVGTTQPYIIMREESMRE